MSAPVVRNVLLGTAALVVIAAVLALGVVYGVSEWQQRRPWDAPLAPLRAPAAADPIAGEHMARVVGCWAGCHGTRGQGGVAEVAGIHRTTAPTLSAVLPAYTDAELVRLIRYGVKRDGRSAVGMSSHAFWPLGEQDLANIIAHLRRQPPSPPVPREHSLTFRGRLAMLTGEWGVSAALVDRSRPRWGELPRRTAVERGRYLASIVCAECHGVDWHGSALEAAPSLVIVGTYDATQFNRFLRTGIAANGRNVEAMSSWLPEVAFTDGEIADLYAFLREYHGFDAAP